MGKYPKVININGALIALYPIKGLKAVGINVKVRAGSWHEEGNNWGKAHLLEHMLFQGTKRFIDDQAMEIFKEENGIWDNTWTSGSQLQMSLRMPSESFKAGVDLISEMLFKASMPEEKLNKEKKIIAQEYEDKWSKPNARFFRKVNEQYFGENHLYTRDGLGKIEYVRNITRQELIDYQKEMIVPANMSIGIAGNFNINEVEKDLRNILLLKGNRAVINFKKVKPSVKRLVYFEPGMTSATVNMGWLARGIEETSFEDRLKINIASYLLGGSTRSLLFKKIREEMGIAYDIWTDEESYPSVTRFKVRTSVKPEKIEELLLEVDRVIEKFTNGPIDKEIFRRAKNYLMMSRQMAYESSMGTAESLSSSLFWEGKVISPEEYKEVLGKVKEEGIRAIIKEVSFGKKPLISIMKSK